MKSLARLALACALVAASVALAEPAATRRFFNVALFGPLAEVKRMVGEDRSLLRARDRRGFTALHLVATESRPEVQGFLLEAGADPNAVTEDGTTPLHIAAEPEFVALLLRHGARVDLPAKNGDTPLHSHASERDSAAVVRALIVGGASRDARNRRGQTPFDIARSRGDAELMRLLRP